MRSVFYHLLESCEAQQDLICFHLLNRLLVDSSGIASILDKDSYQDPKDMHQQASQNTVHIRQQTNPNYPKMQIYLLHFCTLLPFSGVDFQEYEVLGCCKS